MPATLGYGVPVRTGAILASPTTTVTATVAFVKASNTRANARFGCSVALTSDALAVGSDAESSSATGINGNQVDTTAPSAGAVYAY